MALPFDATLKELFRQYLPDWLAVLGFRDRSPQVLTPDLSTLGAFADTVVRLRRLLLHVEFQSGPDASLGRRMLLSITPARKMITASPRRGATAAGSPCCDPFSCRSNNAALHHRYETAVHSVVVLLHRQAAPRGLTGRVSYDGRAGRGRMRFAFEVIRLWQRPAEGLLRGGLGALPLAVLAELPGGRGVQRSLPAVVARIEERAVRELPPPQANQLLTAAFILTGLRVSDAVALRLFERVQGMRESSTYQWILNQGRTEGRMEGRVEELRERILHQGRLRIGEPAPADVAALEAIADLEHLRRMLDSTLTATTWREVLATR
jgi:hypothetical protein